MATEKEEFYIEKKSYKFYIEFQEGCCSIAIQRQRNIFFEKKISSFYTANHSKIIWNIASLENCSTIKYRKYHLFASYLPSIHLLKWRTSCHVTSAKYKFKLSYQYKTTLVEILLSHNKIKIVMEAKAKLLIKQYNQFGFIRKFRFLFRYWRFLKGFFQ